MKKDVYIHFFVSTNIFLFFKKTLSFIHKIPWMRVLIPSEWQYAAVKPVRIFRIRCMQSHRLCRDFLPATVLGVLPFEYPSKVQDNSMP